MDVISPYPYICKYGKLHFGHPKLYVGADCPPDCFDREGIIKCKVLPPRKLSSGSSVQKQLQTNLPLFSACADTMNQGNCTQSDEERCIGGTWLVDEVRKAVEMGCNVMDVFEF